MKTQLGVFALFQTCSDNEIQQYVSDDSRFNVLIKSQSANTNQTTYCIKKHNTTVGYVMINEMSPSQFRINELALENDEEITRGFNATLDYLFGEIGAESVVTTVPYQDEQLTTILNRIGFDNKTIHIPEGEEDNYQQLVKELVIEKKQFKL